MAEADIVEKLTSIETKLDETNNHLMKIVYALIGLIAASLGLKFIGSPPDIIISLFVCLFVATYLVTATTFQWKHTRWLVKALNLGFAIFMYYSVICRIFLFESGITVAPMWYSTSINIIFVLLGILLLGVSVKFWENNKVGHDSLDGENYDRANR